ncbi:MAG: hypothetical protein KU37_02395 [Sulfuricurvum sp. PC08-66]|nr:MAG: hypothetical protein KU37_02395 [Sulfuricurvum sp. PC08-66]
MSNVESLLKSFQNSNIDVDSLMCTLINNYVLKVNDDIYDFCEIELYYYKKEKHEDCGVLKRDKLAGDIFFHRYGIDICFDSNGTDEYGGILIRSLKKDDEYIFGPLKCSLTLLNRYQPNIHILIQQTQKNKEIICKTTRIKSSCKNNKYHSELYRYVTKYACTVMHKNKEYWQKVQEKSQQCCEENND